MISRRAILRGAAALSLLGHDAHAHENPLLSLYVSHGAPLFMPGQEARRAELAAWGKTLTKPRGAVVMTPHFASRTLAIGALGTGFAWYDLPGRLKRQLPQDLEYRSPPNDALAALLASTYGAPLAHAPERRGFDHTTWMPLLCLLPAADVPVLELCYPYVSEAQTFELGQKLAPLASEGVMFLASGGLTHNLALDFVGPTPAFAVEFDAWATERVLARDVDALLDWRKRAPAPFLAHPDDGAHFRVLLAALGLAVARGASSIASPVHGFDAALSRRCFELR